MITTDTVSDHVQGFLSHMIRDRALSLFTLKSYRADLSQFENFLLKQDPTKPTLEHIVSATPEQLTMFVGDNSRGWKDSTKNRKISTLRSFYGWMTDVAKLVSENPSLHLKSYVVVACTTQVTLQDVVSFINNFTSTYPTYRRDRLIFRMVMETGMRINDLLDITREKLTAEATLKICSVGGKERTIPITSELHRDLLAYVAETRRPEHSGATPLFLSKYGLKVPCRSIRRNFHRQALRNGSSVSKVLTPKSLRVAFVHYQRHIGTDEQIIADRLGLRSKYHLSAIVTPPQEVIVPLVQLMNQVMSHQSSPVLVSVSRPPQLTAPGSGRLQAKRKHSLT